MSIDAPQAGTWTLALDERERGELLQLLEVALGDLRVEVHHTHHSPDFRARLLEREELLRRLIEKFRRGGP
jgi:hypothetical protein